VLRNKKIPYWPSAIDIPLIVLAAIEEKAPMNWGDGSLAIAVPDVMIPGEYYASRRAASSLNPTKRLMLAVLLDGIRSFQAAAEGIRKSAQRRFEDAETWLFDENGDGPFSFDSICEELRIEPQYLRAGLKRWRTLHLAGKSTQRLGRNAPVVRSGRIIISHSRARRSRTPRG
jgi:hypothetical protein